MKNNDFNTTSLAEERTLLALERTFSAWLRTALAAMGGGLAILRLLSFKSETHKIIAHIIGEILILWGCLLIILSSADYKKMCATLPHAKNYKKSSFGFLILVLPLLVIAALLIWVTLP
jgi:putative membrane protein